MSTGTGHSFVYPVRSLLTGNILPAAQGEREQPPADHQSSRRRRKRNARGLGQGREPSPNFRHYPGPSNDTAAELSFATAPVQVPPKIVLNPPSSTSSTADNGNVSDPDWADSLSFYTATTGTGSPLSESSPRHPQNITEAASDVFSGSATNLEFYTRSLHPQQVNLSDTSIVHLPPPRSTLRLAHNQGIPIHSGCSQHASDPHSTSYSPCSSSQHTQSIPQSLYGALPSSYEDDTSITVNLEGQESLAHTLPSSSSVGSGSDAHETGGSGGYSSGYPSSDEPLVTFRFKHREDGDGHHVVIGREGKLSRCEDEVSTSTSCISHVFSLTLYSLYMRMYQPIRTPGAVQGFGVLIVVQEDLDGDKLVVRQVSENSTELLGLSPHYLFSLACFTDVLPDSQTGILWDNIPYLADPDEDSPSEDDSPHVFLLSGWGMPGSALLDDSDSDPQCRRAWSCWCAAHRPKIDRGAANNGIHDLIILEFELEDDVFNPLYHAPSPAQDVDQLSGVSLPGSSESTGSTITSGTLVSVTPTPPSLDPVANMSSSINSSSPPESTLTSLPMSSLISEGDDSRTPSAEDILESTTNHAKPLLALERFRKLSQVVKPSSATDPGVGVLAADSLGSISSAHTRRGKQRRKNRTVGMMDAFAVLSQVNEQLCAASDLDTFLKVVVGLVKDLTQFHRVLVYQFDENWNGQAVAELVDWNHTHDLYRGLHFPASDIPAQVG
jgi:hypothetical protein